MSGKWQLLDALRGGTETMRMYGETYLPREPNETAKQYDARLKRSFLFPTYDDAIANITAQPFSKVVSMSGALPESFEGMWDDVDGSGTSITDFAIQVFDDAVDRGLSFIFVDFPSTQSDLTLGEERSLGLRPYFIHVRASQIIGYRSATIQGKETLTQVRIREQLIEPDGKFSEKEVSQVRVFNSDGTWELWRGKDKEDEWVLHDSGTHTFDGIPLVKVFTHRVGFMNAVPPLSKLADLNLAHWQSSSDQRNILHYARVPILFRSGFTPEELDKPIQIGAAASQGSANPDAKISWVEHSGRAIDAGAADVKRLEERMEVLAAKPFISQRTGGITATSRAIDESRASSNIQNWVRRLENGILGAFKLASKWTNVELDESFGIEIFSEFSIANRSHDNVKVIESARSRGDLDRETWLSEMKRYGILSEHILVDELEDALEEEGDLLVE